MSTQFGMQMPGGRGAGGSSLDVYTGLLLLAVVALGVACAVVFLQGGKIGKDGSAIGLHEEGQPVTLKETTGS